MAANRLRIGIVGCGRAAHSHAFRLLAVEGVAVAGFSDADAPVAEMLAARFSTDSAPIPTFADHAELIRQTAPDAVAIFTPHSGHYRPAMDALQAGCHVFVEWPLSTSVQEAVDIANLARGRSLKVAVGHHFRLLPSLARAREMLAGGAIGPVRLVTATASHPSLEARRGEEQAGRSDPRFVGGGLADLGIHLVDALLWTVGRPAELVSAIQAREESGLDLVTAASIRLAGGTLATVAITGVAPGPISDPGFVFELIYHGEKGRIRAIEDRLSVEIDGGEVETISFPTPFVDIDADFAKAILGGTAPCCPADQALDSVRVLEAMARSATIGQFVDLA